MATTILTLDGDVAVRHVLKDFFTGFGINVNSAADFYTAMSTLGQGLPQLIILEFTVTGGSAKDVIDGVHFRPDGSAVPFIILTAAPLAEVELLVPASPLVRYLKKPLDLAELKSTVEEFLGPQTFAPPAPPPASFPPGYPPPPGLAAGLPPGYPPPGYPYAFPPTPAPMPTFEDEAQYSSDQNVIDLDAPEGPPRKP
jgi:CheY-like chemotaxis protein